MSIIGSTFPRQNRPDYRVSGRTLAAICIVDSIPTERQEPHRSISISRRAISSIVSRGLRECPRLFAHEAFGMIYPGSKGYHVRNYSSD